jgi:hypothetical protein
LRSPCICASQMQREPPMERLADAVCRMGLYIAPMCLQSQIQPERAPDGGAVRRKGPMACAPGSGGRALSPRQSVSHARNCSATVASACVVQTWRMSHASSIEVGSRAIPRPSESTIRQGVVHDSFGVVFHWYLDRNASRSRAQGTLRSAAQPVSLSRNGGCAQWPSTMELRPRRWSARLHSDTLVHQGHDDSCGASMKGRSSMDELGDGIPAEMQNWG